MKAIVGVAVCKRCNTDERIISLLHLIRQMHSVWCDSAQREPPGAAEACSCSSHGSSSILCNFVQVQAVVQ